MVDTIASLLLENVQPRSGRGGWHGGSTPLGALRGVTVDQAAWVPLPGRKSIWQLALHPRRYGEATPGGKRWATGELILGIAQHDAYHAGQIQMLKRLWTTWIRG
jgi:hypothetical protein